MSQHTTETEHGKTATDASPSGRSRLRRLVNALTVVAFLAIGLVALYALSLILTAVVVLLLSALLAYFSYPLVQFLQRRLTRPLAIVVAFLLIAGVLVVVMLIVAFSINPQVASLVKYMHFLMSPAGARRIQSFIDYLGTFGITKDQVGQLKNQLFSQAQGALSGLLPFLIGVLGNIFDFIIVIVLSVYFVLDGPRIIHWLSSKTPVNQRGIITFLLRTLDQSLGGYFRGTFLLALGGALCTGVVLALLHVPYAAVLAVLFFLLYFLPVIGTYLIAALCILAALPQGWVVMLIVAVFMVLLLGVVMGQILAPRVFSTYRGSASHRGHFRALRRCRTLRIDWRVPRYPCCWRPPAYRCGILAQMGAEASRTIPARRVAASTINAVARTKGRASRFTRPGVRP